MSMRPLSLCLLLALPPCSALAQTATWRVVAGENAQVLAPDLPAGSFRDLQDVLLGDRGAEQIGFRVASPTAQVGYWAFQAGRFQRWAQFGSAGAGGPGRTGGESAHQFLSFGSDSGDAGSDGQRLLRARAGDPANTAGASFGIWRWNGQGNIEIARGGTDGPLGPGLGTDWVFRTNTASFADAQMLDQGRLLLVGTVVSPGAIESRLVARHVPGQGNRPCLRTTAQEPGLSPGLSPGDSFANFTQGLDRFVSTSTGQVFGLLPITGGGEGLFAICDGAPAALAVTNRIGALGPDSGEANTLFLGFSRLRPSPTQGLLFSADWRVSGGSTRVGLFQHLNGRNLPIAYNDAGGQLGPNWQNSTWTAFTALSVARDWLAYTANVRTSEGGSATGLWRQRVGQAPELVALLSLTATGYIPEFGRTWRSFDAFAVLANGDIVLNATTNPDIVRDLWRLAPGQNPQRLLSSGQTLSVPTASGPASTSVTSFSLPGDGLPETGRDGWVGADGQLLVRVNTSSFGSLLISRRLDVPDPNQVFRNGFE